MFLCFLLNAYYWPSFIRILIFCKTQKRLKYRIVLLSSSREKLLAFTFTGIFTLLRCSISTEKFHFKCNIFYDSGLPQNKPTLIIRNRELLELRLFRILIEFEFRNNYTIVFLQEYKEKQGVNKKCFFS